MQVLKEALRVKENTIFDLLQHTFYERDFAYFIKLAVHLGDVTGYDNRKAIKFGELSQLLYLSSLLHYSLTEDTTNTQQLRAEKQMPVLLGDLIYGRFISMLTNTGNTGYLPLYLTYLKVFNANGVEELEGRMVFDMHHAVQILTEKTAEIMASASGVAVAVVQNEANQYFQTHWDAEQGEKVTTFAALEAMM